jgi:hypothetical protein
MTPVDVPPVFAAMADDLLISDHWSKLPPRPQPWARRQWGTAASFLTGQKWRAWSYNDWLIALTFLTVGISLVEGMTRMYRAAHR